MADPYRSLSPQLAELLREGKPVQSGEQQSGIVARQLFGQTALSEPWIRKAIGELLPPLVVLAAERLDDHTWVSHTDESLRASLYRALCSFVFERLDIRNWPDLAELSVLDFQSELSERSLTVLAEMLFDRAASASATSQSRDQDAAGANGKSSHLGLGDPLPSNPPGLVPTQIPSVHDKITELLSILDDRQLYILQQRLFIRTPKTLAKIAEELDLTRERVRQIESRSTKKLMHELQKPEFSVAIRAAAESFREQIGAAFVDSHSAVNDLLENQFGDVVDDQPREFLIWLAGPYRYEHGIWVHPELWRPDELDEALEQLLESEQSDHDSVVSVYGQFDVRPEFVDRLIENNSKLNRISDTYFWGRPTWANRTVALLKQLGEPMTIEEIAEYMDAGSDYRGLRNALANSNDIFKVDTKRYGLPEWGQSEYTGVSDAIAMAIEEQGGFADFSELAPVVAERTGALEQTIRLYGQAPRFVISDGRIRLRRDNEQFKPRTDRLLTRRTVFVFDGYTTIRFGLSPDDMRGSGRSVPDDILFHLGAQLNERIVYRGHHNLELPITRPDSAPESGSLGSLRELSLALGAEAGDELRIDFHMLDRRFEATVVSQSVLTDLGAIEQLRLLTGAKSLTTAALLDELDAALDYPLAGVDASLSVRGDDDVLTILRAMRE